VTNSPGKLPRGIDVRGNGGYIIVPPSRIDGGGEYRGNGLDIADAPDWLYDLVLPPRPDPEPNKPGTSDDGGHHARQGGHNRWRSLNDQAIRRYPDWVPILFPTATQTKPGEWRVKSSSPDLNRKLKEDLSFHPDGIRDWGVNDMGDKREGKRTAIDVVMWRLSMTPEEAARWLARRLGLETPTTKSIVIVRASEVPMRAKRWLWTGHLLRGAQELTTGIPGLGKSQVQCGYIACVTTGRPWPNGESGTAPADVIMITAEDALDQEVVPRLIAAGADLNRVHIVKAIKIDDKTSRRFLLAEDLDQLAMKVVQIGNVGLVTLDPITAYMGGKIDSHKTTQVRSQLGPLKDFAETYDVAVSTITHPPKNFSKRAIDHFIGSQAFIAAGRIGHVCAEEMREDEATEEMVPTGRILFAHAKHNPSAKMPTLVYRQSVLDVGIDPKTGAPIDAPYLVWEKEAVNVSADEAVGMRERKAGGAQIKAQEFLRQILVGKHPVAQKYIMEEGKQRHGFTEKQLRTAKERLGIVSEKGLDGWTWVLPPRPAGPAGPAG
jgi:hypothetical protein